MKLDGGSRELSLRKNEVVGELQQALMALRENEERWVKTTI